MNFETARQYFRVESGPCWQALMDWRTKRQDIDAQCLQFAKECGGVGFYAGHDDNVGNALSISAVIFAGELPSGWKYRNWKSFTREQGKTPGWPDKRSGVGKAALRAIEALPLRPSSYAVCDAIGFPTSISYHKEGARGSCHLGFWETAKIGWHRDTFYVALPKLADEIAKYQAQGYTVDTPNWTPLDGMVPILKEEMDLDFARARLTEAEAA